VSSPFPPAGDSSVGLLVAIRRQALLVVAATVLFAVAGYVLAARQPAQYTATATVTVARPDTLPVYRTVSNGDASNLQLTVANQLHDTRTMAKAAQALHTSAADLAPRVNITPEAQTSLIDVSATAAHRAAAAITANEVITAYQAVAAQDAAQHTANSVAPLQSEADQITKQIAALGPQVVARAAEIRSQVQAEFSGTTGTTTVAGAQDRAVQAALQSDPEYSALRASLTDQQTQLDSVSQKIRQLQVDGTLMGRVFSHVDPADVPTKPDTISPARAAVLGGVVGFLLGCALAWRRAERRKPMSAQHASGLLAAPVLLELELPRGATGDLRRTGAFAAGDGRLASLAVALSRFVAEHQVRNLVTAPATDEPEGPAVALALAVAMSGNGDDVTLVDAGDGGGRLTALAGLAGTAGMRDLVAGRAGVHDALGSLDAVDGRLPFVGLGTGPEPAVGAIATRLGAITAGDSLALVDAPGLETSGHAIGAAANRGALLLVTSERTDPSALSATRTKLTLAGTLLVGIVHVRSRSRRGWPERGRKRASVAASQVPAVATAPSLLVGPAAEG
jgi:capsular polysaccharide biosynthesis protein